jgi:hypothetical protein
MTWPFFNPFRWPAHSNENAWLAFWTIALAIIVGGIERLAL